MPRFSRGYFTTHVWRACSNVPNSGRNGHISACSRDKPPICAREAAYLTVGRSGLETS